MRRKIILSILVVILSFGFLISAKSSVLTADEYRIGIEQLEQEIKELEEELETLKSEVLLLEQEYNQLKKEFDETLTEDDMYQWLNQCNIYNVRANMKVEAKHYNSSFFGIVKDEQVYNGSGFIFCSSGDYKYVLTTYFLTDDKGYDNKSYTLYDAFQTKYTATLFSSSEEYGIAVLRFQDTYVNDLYVAPLAQTDPTLGEGVCNIYSLNNSAYNHMNFAKILSYNETPYFTFNVFTNEVDTKSSIYGSMSVNMDGEVVGMVSMTLSDSSYCRSIPVSKIIEYLKTVGFSFN